MEVVKVKKLLFYLVIIISFCIISPINGFTWDDEKTHPNLSAFAADNSILSSGNGNYLQNIGLNSGLDENLLWNGLKKTVEEWIQYGSTLEDAGTIWQLATNQGRSFNHFHNPIKQYPWTDAGLDDWIFLPPFHTTGESSLLWAQDGANQEKFLEKDWSWQKVSLSQHF
jgi:hypothetical protein